MRLTYLVVALSAIATSTVALPVFESEALIQSDANGIESSKFNNGADQTKRGQDAKIFKRSPNIPDPEPCSCHNDKSTEKHDSTEDNHDKRRQKRDIPDTVGKSEISKGVPQLQHRRVRHTQVDSDDSKSSSEENSKKSHRGTRSARLSESESDAVIGKYKSHSSKFDEDSFIKVIESVDNLLKEELKVRPHTNIDLNEYNSNEDYAQGCEVMQEESYEANETTYNEVRRNLADVDDAPAMWGQ